MFRLTRLVKATLLPTIIFFGVTADAGERESRIIDSAVNAYGGNALLNLKSFKYTDTIDHFFSHQSGHSLQGPTSQHYNQIHIEVNTDFEHKRSELKRLTKLIVGYHENRNVTATHRTFSGSKGYDVDHFKQTYRVSERINFSNADLGYSQMLDPIVVKNLVADKAQAQWVDTAFIEGRSHDVLTVHAGTEKEYSVYIDEKTKLLSRMLQKRGSSLRSYSFLQHQLTEGVVWAKQLIVGTEEALVYHTDNRKFHVNPQEKGTFEPPSGYRASVSDAYFDVSQLTIRELAEGVYYVGKDWGYTLFIDAGGYYISAGAWGMSDRSDDWLQALDLLHQTTGDKLPVKYHLVSHHHTDHMSELHDVLDHGAKLLIHPSDINSVRQFLGEREVPDSQFRPVDMQTSLAQGKVMLFDVPSSQASHNLAIYLPEHKIVFSEDVFGSSFLSKHHSPRSWPHMDTYQRLARFTKQLGTLKLDVERYLSSHHGRVLSHADVEEALKTTLPTETTIVKRLFNASH